MKSLKIFLKTSVLESKNMSEKIRDKTLMPVPFMFEVENNLANSYSETHKTPFNTTLPTSLLTTYCLHKTIVTVA